MNDTNYNYEQVMIDYTENSFTILNGTLGTYNLKDIVKIEIVDENSKYKGKGEPFKYSTSKKSPFNGKSFFVGLKITMKDGNVLALYISKKEVKLSSDAYLKDKEEAETIKSLLEGKETAGKQIKEKGEKFNTLHKDMKQYWKGKILFYFVAIAGAIFISINNINFKEIFPNVGGKETHQQIIDNAIEKLDTLISFDVVDHKRNKMYHIENGKNKDIYTVSYCENEICTNYLYEEDKVLISSDNAQYTPLNVDLKLEECSFTFINEEDFIGKGQYRYDIQSKLPIYIKNVLATYDTPKSKRSWNYLKEGQNRYYNGVLDKEETSTDEIVYSNDGVKWRDGYKWSTYTIQFVIDKEGYLKKAILTFEDDASEIYEYDYEFINFKK